MSDLFSHPAVITVSELNRHARQLLEQRFPLSWISGEISNFARAASGHWYFSLKDESAQVRCAMFRTKNQFMDWLPQDGWQVEVRAQVTLFESKGEFQLAVETMRRSGLGALYEAFDKLKQRLQEEGLFSAARKKPLPLYPRRIALVTSPHAAALRDVLATLNRRMPNVLVFLYPTPVQGEGCGLKIAAAIQLAGQNPACDLIIVCRGGGSIEDLWGFNEECVARAIYASPLPVISGVGHETDFTIADFVADVRAPTPTAAAELAVRHRKEVWVDLNNLRERLIRYLQSRLDRHAQKLDLLTQRLVHPGQRLAQQKLQLLGLSARLNNGVIRSLASHRHRLMLRSAELKSAQPKLAAMEIYVRRLKERLQNAMRERLRFMTTTVERYATNINHLNPQAVLQRGFSIVTHQQKIVRSATQIQAGEELDIQFAQGRAAAIVKKN